MSVIASQITTNTALQSSNDITPLVVAPNGYIYVKFQTMKVFYFTLTGTYVGYVTVSDYITQFAVDYTNNILYCAGPNSLYSINTTTNTVGFSTALTGGGIIGCVYSSDGYIYATRGSGFAIMKFSSTGTLIGTIFDNAVSNSITPTGTFGQCTLDSNQYLYCISQSTGNIYKFDRSGGLLGFVASTGTSYGNLYGITCDTTSNILYASSIGATGGIFKIKNGTSSLYTTVSSYSYCIFYDKNTAKLYASNRPYYVVIINPEIIDSYTVSPPSIPNYFPGTVALSYKSANSVIGKTYNLINSSSTVVSTVTFTVPDTTFPGITAPGNYSYSGIKAVGNGKIYLQYSIYGTTGNIMVVYDMVGNIITTFNTPGGYGASILDLSNTRIYNTSCVYIDLSSNTVSNYLSPNSIYVNGGIAIGSDGFIYVLTQYNFNRINPTAQTYTNTNPRDSGNNTFTFTSCTFGSDGYVYGISNVNTIGAGTIYKFTTAGVYVSTLATLPETDIRMCTCDTVTNTIYAASNTTCYKITSSGTVSVFRTYAPTNSAFFVGLYYDKTSGDLFFSDFTSVGFGIVTGISTIYRCFLSSDTSTKPITFNFAGTYLNGDTTTFNIKDASGNSFGIPVTITQIYPCFLQGSKILRLNPETDEESYVPVETLRRGDLILTATCGYKAVSFIGRGTLSNPADDPDKKNRLYGFRDAKGRHPTLYLTGEHCLLYKESEIPEAKRREVREHMGDDYITETFHRVPACLDERREAYKGHGPATIWHFALEHNNLYNNYAVFANGILVETCSIDFLTKKSRLQLV